MLNHKQTVFVYEYLKSGNAYQSAIRAGYSHNYAKAQSHQMLENVGIRNEIESFKKSIMHSTGITIETVVNQINDLAENAERDSDKLKALDMLMKHLGAYYTLQDIIERLTPEQVEQLHKKLVEYIKV